MTKVFQRSGSVGCSVIGCQKSLAMAFLLFFGKTAEMRPGNHNQRLIGIVYSCLVFIEQVMVVDRHYTFDFVQSICKFGIGFGKFGIVCVNDVVNLIGYHLNLQIAESIS